MSSWAPPGGRLRHHLAATLRRSGPSPEQIARDPDVQRAISRLKPRPISDLIDEATRNLLAAIPREAPLPESIHFKRRSPEARSRMSEAAKRRWQNKAERGKLVLAAKRRSATPEGKAQLEKMRRATKFRSKS